MVGTAIQLLTLRDLEEPLEATIDRIAETSFDGVEFSGLGVGSPAKIADRLDDNGLSAVGAHVDADRLEDEYEAVVADYDALGCNRLVVSPLAPRTFATDHRLDVAASRLAELATRLTDDGFQLCYHTGSFEFARSGATAEFDRLAGALDHSVGLEIDTGLATCGGADPISLLDRYADRVPLVHLTDSRSGSDATVHVELGGGEVDVPACVEAALDNDVEWIVYEHGRTTDPLASLEHSDSVLSRLVPTESA